MSRRAAASRWRGSTRLARTSSACQAPGSTPYRAAAVGLASPTATRIARVRERQGVPPPRAAVAGLEPFQVLGGQPQETRELLGTVEVDVGTSPPRGVAVTDWNDGASDRLQRAEERGLVLDDQRRARSPSSGLDDERPCPVEGVAPGLDRDRFAPPDAEIAVKDDAGDGVLGAQGSSPRHGSVPEPVGVREGGGDPYDPPRPRAW